MKNQDNRTPPSAHHLRWIIIGVTLFLAGLALFFTSSGNDTEEQVLTTLDGQTRTLDDFEGDILLVNFWATWCGPCRVEMPELQAYYDANMERGLEMVVVNRGESIEQIQSYLSEYDYTFPIAIDLNNELYDNFNLLGTPSTVLLNKNGDVLWTHNGILLEEQLSEMVGPYLE